MSAVASKAIQIHRIFASVSFIIAFAFWLVSGRLVCEQLISCERQQIINKEFWIESFRLIRKLLSGVDYKGVREIMKGCRDKIQLFPQNISSSIVPQMQAVESVIEHIFDRSASLLPAYFIGNEIQKSGSLHWKIADLTTRFVEDFRHVAQIVSVIGHPHMLPIVEHFGYNDSLINPWRLDSTSLKFTFCGILPYDTELFMPQTKLLRYILEQPYSKDMVCSMLNLQKAHKQRCSAVEEQLVWLIMSAMERSEQEMVKCGDADETFSNIHWLWVHISSQLIYFVLLQFASFPNIVTTLHDRVSVCFYENRSSSIETMNSITILACGERVSSWTWLPHVGFASIHFRQHSKKSGEFEGVLIQRVACYDSFPLCSCRILCQCWACMTCCIQKRNRCQCRTVRKPMQRAR